MIVVRGYKKAIEIAKELVEAHCEPSLMGYDGVGDWESLAVQIYRHPSKRLYAVGDGLRSAAIYQMDGGQ